jgi:NitT/TauT family transport system substrate-binding protein
VALLLALAASGCGLGGDDDAVAKTTQPPGGHLHFPGAKAVGDGCGDAAHTATDDLAADRTVARCAAGSPAPIPLPAPATVRVGVRATQQDGKRSIGAELAPVLLAKQLGEFDKENLTVEITPYADTKTLFAALDAGVVDVVAGDLDAPFFDLVNKHLQDGTPGPRLVMGGAVASRPNDLSTPQAGLWVRSDMLTKSDRWSDLEDEPVAVQGSIGDAVTEPITALLRQDDISLNEVHLDVMTSPEAATGMLDEKLAAAWLDDPDWRRLVGNDRFRLAATLPVSESLGGVMFGPRLVEPDQDRAVGVAFSRAVIRTINTDLGRDYEHDDHVMRALADATHHTLAVLRSTPPWVFDWEVRTDTTTRIQATLVGYGAVLYESELPERQVVDRTLYRDALVPRPAP